MLRRTRSVYRICRIFCQYPS